MKQLHAPDGNSGLQVLGIHLKYQCLLNSEISRSFKLFCFFAGAQWYRYWAFEILLGDYRIIKVPHDYQSARN
jgi:hypothetical protein